MEEKLPQMKAIKNISSGIYPSLTVGREKTATNPVNMGGVAVFVLYRYVLYFSLFHNFCIFNNCSHRGFRSDLVIRAESKGLMQRICEVCTGI